MYYTRNIGILLLLLGLGSCQDIEKTPKPKDLIPEDKMINVLVDLAKVDAAISLNSHGYKQRGAPGRKLILQKYHIDSLQLIKSNSYYAEHFKINERLYDSVQARLQRQNDSLYALEKKERKKKKKK